MGLGKEFISSVVRQLGRDTGKSITNSIKKDNQYTNMNNQNLDFEIDIDIQPKPPNESIAYYTFIGLLISIIPFGTLYTLIVGIYSMFKKTENIYRIVPNMVRDRRFKSGYRQDGYSKVDSNFDRDLDDFEVKGYKRRGKGYLLSILIIIISSIILLKYV